MPFDMASSVHLSAFGVCQQLSPASQHYLPWPWQHQACLNTYASLSHQKKDPRKFPVRNLRMPFIRVFAKAASMQMSQYLRMYLHVYLTTSLYSFLLVRLTAVFTLNLMPSTTLIFSSEYQYYEDQETRIQCSPAIQPYQNNALINQYIPTTQTNQHGSLYTHQTTSNVVPPTTTSLSAPNSTHTSNLRVSRNQRTPSHPHT